jgi:purine-cytosine permease-like protein
MAFRWAYIALPVSLFIISAALAAYYYRLLPEETAYHFVNGTPDRWLDRGAIIAALVAPQAICALLAFAIVRVAISGISRYALENAPLKKITLAMGNMTALLQVILLFAALDIFFYNVYEIKLMPLWAFSLIFLVLAGLALGIFFIQAIRQLRRSQDKSPRE